MPTEISQANRWVILAAVLMAFVPIAINMTILHVAVPSLTLALDATGAQMLWMIDIYPLIMAGLLVPMGTLADRVGHRRMLLSGLVVFLIASLIAAFAPGAGVLIGARALLAFGAAMVMPNILAIIRQTFDRPRELGLALGLWSTIASCGAALGPLVGGFLLEHFWWGSVFLINLPVIPAVWLLAYFKLPRRAPQATGNWSVGQAIILLSGLISTIYAIKSGFGAEDAILATGATALAGISLLLWFVRLQLRSPAPMLDIKLFATPAISMGVVIAVVVSGSLAGIELTIAQELQFVVGLTPLKAGLFLLPLILASALGGPFAGYLVERLGLRMVAVSSLLVSGACVLGLGVSDFHTAGLGVIGLLSGLGLALGIGLTASSLAIMSSVTPAKAGVAGSLEATGYELGAGLGITIFGMLLSASYANAIRIPEQLAGRLPESATRSIGETLNAASHVGVHADLLKAAARMAFSSAHAVALISGGLAIAAVGIVALVTLRNYKPIEGSTGH